MPWSHCTCAMLAVHACSQPALKGPSELMKIILAARSHYLVNEQQTGNYSCYSCINSCLPAKSTAWLKYFPTYFRVMHTYATFGSRSVQVCHIVGQRHVVNRDVNHVQYRAAHACTQVIKSLHKTKELAIDVARRYQLLRRHLGSAASLHHTHCCMLNAKGILHATFLNGTDPIHPPFINLHAGKLVFGIQSTKFTSL